VEEEMPPPSHKTTVDHEKETTPPSATQPSLSESRKVKGELSDEKTVKETDQIESFFNHEKYEKNISKAKGYPVIGKDAVNEDKYRSYIMSIGSSSSSNSRESLLSDLATSASATGGASEVTSKEQEVIHTKHVVEKKNIEKKHAVLRKKEKRRGRTKQDEKYLPLASAHAKKTHKLNKSRSKRRVPHSSPVEISDPSITDSTSYHDKDAPKSSKQKLDYGVPSTSADLTPADSSSPRQETSNSEDSALFLKGHEVMSWLFEADDDFRPRKDNLMQIQDRKSSVFDTEVGNHELSNKDIANVNLYEDFSLKATRELNAKLEKLMPKSKGADRSIRNRRRGGKIPINWKVHKSHPHYPYAKGATDSSSSQS